MMAEREKAVAMQAQKFAALKEDFQYNLVGQEWGCISCKLQVPVLAANSVTRFSLNTPQLLNRGSIAYINAVFAKRGD